MNKKLVVGIGSILLILSYFHAATWAKVDADSLILKDDGAIWLSVDSPVLAATTDKEAPKDQKPPETKQTSEPPKLVPVVAANHPATVTVNPKNDKQVTVTVTEVKSPKSGTLPPTAPTAGAVISTKNVDKVVVEGKNKSVIMSITPSTTQTLTIDNQGTQAQTSLPLQIDSTTHAVSATSQGGGQVNVLLPKVVLQNLESERLVSQPSANQPSAVLAQMSLNLQGNDVVYTVTQQRKLFNTIPMPPSIITVSNETGKSSVPLYSRLFGLIFF